jgi:citrate lyase subunit beta/citryl-CoA lyase
MKNSYWTDKTELPTIEWNGYRNYLPAAVPSGNITDFQGNGGVSMAKLRRTLAWVIGGDDAKLQQVLASEADAITIELEDLCPAEAKESARAWAVDKLQHVDFGEKEVGVRINSFESPWGRKDLEAILPCHPNFIRLPKCENPRDVLDVDAIITQYELTHDLPRNTMELLLMIETPLGVRNAYELASCTKRVTGLTLGAVDLTTAMGVKRDLTEKCLQLVYAKEKLVMDAKAAGVEAYDTAVFCPEGSNKEIEEFVRIDTEDDKKMGFAGRGLTNLNHVPIINAVYSIPESEIDFARRVVAAYENASDEEKAHVFVDGKYVDVPVYRAAQRLLEKVK